MPAEIEAANRIVLNPNEARSFAQNGNSQTRGFFGELFSTKDLNEECYKETKGCNVEEVMEYFKPNAEQAVSIKPFFNSSF